MKKFLFFLLGLLLLACLCALVLNPEKYAKCTLEGLNLWAFTVLPALLPFVFLTLLIKNAGGANFVSRILSPATAFLYGTNGTAPAFAALISCISGYPVGAKTVAELYKSNLIDQADARTAALFCSTSGPSFVIGSVGVRMLGSAQAGALIYVCHVLSAAFCGVIFRKRRDNGVIAPLFNKEEPSVKLYDCAMDATLSCLCVGTLITVFYVFNQVLSDLNLTAPLVFAFAALLKDENKAAALTAGLIECTKGCFMAANAAAADIPLICAIVSFGGLSVIAQSMAFLSRAQVKAGAFVLGKAAQAVIAYILSLIACRVFL